MTMFNDIDEKVHYVHRIDRAASMAQVAKKNLQRDDSDEALEDLHRLRDYLERVIDELEEKNADPAERM